MASTIYRQNTASSSDIKSWQKQLNSLGYDTGGVDGVWGTKTAQAISDYKKSINQNNTYGTTVGTSTLTQLAKDANAKSSSSSSSSLATGSSLNVNYADNAATKAYEDLLAQGNVAGQQIQDQWNSALASAQASYNNSASNLGNVYNSNVNSANMSADEAARQQYIAYKQNKNKLGEQLSTQGITGGASETALNGIMNAYSAALSANEGDRQAALADLASSYQNELSNLWQTLNSSQSSINSSYGSAYADAQTAYEEKLAEAKQASKIEQSINNWNTNVANRIQEVNPKYVWTDNLGKLHWSNYQSKAEAAAAQGYTLVTGTTFKNNYLTDNSKSSSSSSSSNSSTSDAEIASLFGLTDDSKTTSNTSKNYTYTSVKKRGK